MTRLIKEDVEEIRKELEIYDSELNEKAGLSLRQVACAAAGVTEKDIIQKASNNKAAVIPITVGEGIIPSFATAVQSIIQHLGFQTVVTTETDVAGVAEAIVNGANILFMADDFRFIALNIQTGTIVDNGAATGKGFAAALDGLARGLEGKEVLVLGAGPVGIGAVAFLKMLGVKPAVFDIDETKVEKLKDDTSIKLESDLNGALATYHYIVDATPQGGFIELDDMHPNTKMACPGMPLGLSPTAYPSLKDGLIHDPLQIGVATMLTMALL
ncbi:MAG: 3-methylornithyl-N6-L-lysine dehydrogenase PylD [Desulfitobacteriaceae bacterium]|nr:3-methylornithyl-N6-L-lysine dehydrogenase PylD [Desulfitobacteriaceae bacterium]